MMAVVTVDMLSKTAVHIAGDAAVAVWAGHTWAVGVSFRKMIGKYLDEARPKLALPPDPSTLFVTQEGHWALHTAQCSVAWSRLALGTSISRGCWESTRVRPSRCVP